VQPTPEDLAVIAGELQGDLHGQGQRAALLRTAWVDLMRMGLLVFDTLGPGQLQWRLADLPGAATWCASPRLAEARA
jgi:hypothetical protein